MVGAPTSTCSSRPNGSGRGMLRAAPSTAMARAQPRRRPAPARRRAGGPRPQRRGGQLGPPIARDGPWRPRAPLLAGRRLRRNAGLTGTYPTRLNAHQLSERRRRFVADAVAMLRQAVADGFKDAAPAPPRARISTRSAPIPNSGRSWPYPEFPDDPPARRADRPTVLGPGRGSEDEPAQVFVLRQRLEPLADERFVDDDVLLGRGRGRRS